MPRKICLILMPMDEALEVLRPTNPGSWDEGCCSWHCFKVVTYGTTTLGQKWSLIDSMEIRNELTIDMAFIVLL